MTASLTGVVSGVRKTAGGVEVAVEFTDEIGTATVLNIPMQLEKAKTLGIGTEVEVSLKKKRKPRVKAAAATNGAEPTPPPAARGRRRSPAVVPPTE